MAHQHSTTAATLTDDRFLVKRQHGTRSCSACGTVIVAGTRHVYIRGSGSLHLCLQCAVRIYVAREVLA